MKRTDIPAMKPLAHRRGTYGTHRPVVVIDNTQLWSERYTTYRGHSYAPAPTEKRCRTSKGGFTDTTYGMLALCVYASSTQALAELAEAIQLVRSEDLTPEYVTGLNAKLPTGIELGLVNNAHIAGDWDTVHAQDVEEEHKKSLERRNFIKKRNADAQYERLLLDRLEEKFDGYVSNTTRRMDVPLDVMGDLLGIPREGGTK